MIEKIFNKLLGKKSTRILFEDIGNFSLLKEDNMKTIEIMDYRNIKVPIEIKNFDNVVKLTIEVISGDEILHIIYKDYTLEEYDSCYILNNSRIHGFYDYEYTIYDITKNIDCIDIWSKRKNSYDYEDKVEILEEEKKIPEKLKIEQGSLSNNFYIKNEFGTNCSLTKHSKIIADKINEILDYLKSKGDE